MNKTRQQKGLIFIASSSPDMPTLQPIQTELSKHGYETIVYLADKVASGEYPFTVVAGSEGLRIMYKNQTLDTSRIAAAWYRRPSYFGMELEDKAKEMDLDQERRELQSVLWYAIGHGKWLNAPNNIRLGERKLTQLVTAAKIGFSTPLTVTSNRWENITALIQTNESVIMKTSFGGLIENNEEKFIYTNHFSRDKLRALKQTNPFPGIWQHAIPKKREWRITIVGDESFDVAIYTDEHAKDDWRRHYKAGAKFRKEKFPNELKELCVQLLDHYDLRYGAFDFIETPAGEIIFLECNPNGQYGWLEDWLDLPISKAIAHQLMAIADNN